MTPTLDPPYVDLTFMSPLSEARADRPRRGAAYFGDYRGVLGLAYLGLIAV